MGVINLFQGGIAILAKVLTEEFLKVVDLELLVSP